MQPFRVAGEGLQADVGNAHGRRQVHTVDGKTGPQGFQIADRESEVLLLQRRLALDTEQVDFLLSSAQPQAGDPQFRPG